MDWLRENWFWTVLIILFIWMHMKGHGAHGGHAGHGRQAGGGGHDKREAHHDQH